ncbi:MAG TPA: PspC domain-containing protein [Blastocatellia bacterium]|nr:PspC domain-containing protein [Blastocatellia bacterium]
MGSRTWMKSLSILLIVVFIVGCAGPKAPKTENGPQFVRVIQEGYFGGVCAGVAYYFGWNPTVVRLGFVAFTLLGGSGILLYLIMWAFIPYASEMPADYAKRTGT